MSIKLTKAHTIRYAQRPNIYFTQSLRHFVSVDMDLGVRRRLDLAVDEFSRHEAGELVVANCHGCWTRNLFKITSSCPSSRAEEQEISTSFPIFTALSCTPCISSVQFLYHSPMIKTSTFFVRTRTSPSLKSTMCYLIESKPQRRVSQYNKSTLPESRCGWIHDPGQKCPRTKHFAVEFT